MIAARTDTGNKRRAGVFFSGSSSNRWDHVVRSQEGGKSKLLWTGGLFAALDMTFKLTLLHSPIQTYGSVHPGLLHGAVMHHPAPCSIPRTEP